MKYKVAIEYNGMALLEIYAANEEDAKNDAAYELDKMLGKYDAGHDITSVEIITEEPK